MSCLINAHGLIKVYLFYNMICLLLLATPREVMFIIYSNFNCVTLYLLISIKIHIITKLHLMAPHDTDVLNVVEVSLHAFNGINVPFSFGSVT